MNPPCENCKFFIKGNYPQTGTCARYVAYRGRGKMVYEFATQVRADKSKCGPSAKFFIDKKNTSSDRYRLLKSLFEEDE